jgi:hypothetical protein
MLCFRHLVCWSWLNNKLSYGCSIYINHRRLRFLCCRIIQPHSSMIRSPFILMPSSITICTFFPFFRLDRGSILASVIRRMPCGPLRVGAFYVSGLFMVLYVVTIAQFVWGCETHMKRGPTALLWIPLRIVST